MLKYGLSNPRTLLPLIHAAIALALLSSLYLPRWPEWRRRDIAAQQYVEAEARAGRWPPSDDVDWEPCYFGPPREIAAMLPANLPAFLVAGALVIPSSAHDHLLENAPGRILPTTRLLIFMGLFAVVVALQWYVIARLTSTPRTPRLWQRIVYIAPIACVPLGLVLRGLWDDWFRIASLPFWVFMLAGTVLQYWRKSPTKGQAR
jgi:hypothetical protein